MHTPASLRATWLPRVPTVPLKSLSGIRVPSRTDLSLPVRIRKYRFPFCFKDCNCLPVWRYHCIASLYQSTRTTTGGCWYVARVAVWVPGSSLVLQTFLGDTAASIRMPHSNLSQQQCATAAMARGNRCTAQPSLCGEVPVHRGVRRGQRLLLPALPHTRSAARKHTHACSAQT